MCWQSHEHGGQQGQNRPVHLHHGPGDPHAPHHLGGGRGHVHLQCLRLRHRHHDGDVLDRRSGGKYHNCLLIMLQVLVQVQVFLNN